MTRRRNSGDEDRQTCHGGQIEAMIDPISQRLVRAGGRVTALRPQSTGLMSRCSPKSMAEAGGGGERPVSAATGALVRGGERIRSPVLTFLCAGFRGLIFWTPCHFNFRQQKQTLK
jgi:hypothetical protein